MLKVRVVSLNPGLSFSDINCRDNASFSNRGTQYFSNSKCFIVHFFVVY